MTPLGDNMNNYSCTGNIGNDVTLEYTKDSKPILHLNIAIKDRDKTVWIRSTLFGQPAEFVSKYASKGSKLALNGKLTQNEYVDKDGNKQRPIEFFVTDVELLDRKEQSGSETHKQDEKPKQKPKVDTSNVYNEMDISSDDLPF